MLLKELYQGMYGKINEVDDDQMIPYKDKDGESQEMSAKAAKRMAKDHPAKQAYDAMVKDGGSAAKKSVNIFDKPADKPADDMNKGKPNEDDDDYFKMTDDAQEKVADKYGLSAIDLYDNAGKEPEDFNSWDEYEDHLHNVAKDLVGKGYGNQDKRQIGGPNGLEIDRDEIKNIIMKDPEIQDIMGDEDVYWDDGDLVSSKYDDATVASIDPNKPMTIGDLKQAIKDFSEEQGAAQDARDNQEFELVENDKDINRMQQGMQQAIGGDDYEDVPDRLELQGKMKADNGETIIVWKDTDDGMLMGVDAEGNVYEDGEKARYGIGVSTAGSVFGADQNKQRKAENVSFREIKENWIKNNL